MCKLCDSMTPANERDAPESIGAGHYCYGESRFIAAGCAHADCRRDANRELAGLLDLDADALEAYGDGLGTFVRAMGSASAGKGLPG